MKMTTPIYVFVSLLAAALFSGVARSQINLCHSVEVSLYNFSTLSQAFEQTWNGDVDLDWSGDQAVDLPAGEYELLLAFSAGVGNLFAPVTANCFLEAELDFFLATSPQNLSQRRNTVLNAGLSGEIDISEFSQDTATGFLIEQFDGFQGSLSQSALAWLKTESRFTGTGPNFSGVNASFSGSNFASFQDSFFRSPRAGTTTRINWRFELPSDSQWSLRLSAEMSVETGETAFLGGGPTFVDPALEPIPIFYTEDTVQGWLTAPVTEGAILVPEPPVVLIAVTLPPEELDRGSPYRLVLPSNKGGGDLGLFEAGERVDLVALTGAGLPELAVIPTAQAPSTSPEQLSLLLETAGGPAGLRVGPEPAQIDVVFASSFE